MKLFVLTRRKLLIAALLLILCGAGIITAALCGSRKGTETASRQTAATEERKVPIYSVETSEKKVAVSFDAAWGNEQTEELIRILEKYKVKTTFFVVGEWAEKYPESVKALHDAGHEVCNHSDTHPHLPQLSSEEQKRELKRCSDRIEAVTGEAPDLFRPPYGDYNDTLLTSAESLGLHTVQWDVDSLDWKDPSPEEIVERVTSRVHSGSIVLFHNGAKNTPAALPKVLESLQSEGYEIVPVSQLILKEHYTVDGNGVQHPESR